MWTLLLGLAQPHSIRIGNTNTWQWCYCTKAHHRWIFFFCAWRGQVHCRAQIVDSKLLYNMLFKAYLVTTKCTYSLLWMFMSIHVSRITKNLMVVCSCLRLWFRPSWQRDLGRFNIFHYLLHHNSPHSVNQVILCSVWKVSTVPCSPFRVLCKCNYYSFLRNIAITHYGR